MIHFLPLPNAHNSALRLIKQRKTEQLAEELRRERERAYPVNDNRQQERKRRPYYLD